jgi:transmembrane sensor
MKNEEISTLLGKYVDNTISEGEKSVLFNHLNASNDVEFEKALMEKDWDLFQSEETMVESNADKIFNEIVAREEKKPLKLKFGWIGWAAILLIAGFSTFYFLKPDEQKMTAKVNIAVVNVVAETEHKKIVLPDGSTVILNNGAVLIYPHHFDGNKREVTLKGEGYFDIVHDSARPFVVYAGKVKTTVLGTAFNIKAIEGQKVVITVTRGKVSVEDNQKLLAVLTPNQQLTFDEKRKMPSLTKVISQQVVDWQAKDIFFEDITMKDAIDVLAKRFGTKITFVDDRGKNCRFTTTFQKGESLDEILQVITSFNNAAYVTKANEIFISGKDCNN